VVCALRLTLTTRIVGSVVTCVPLVQLARQAPVSVAAGPLSVVEAVPTSRLTITIAGSAVMLVVLARPARRALVHTQTKRKAVTASPTIPARFQAVEATACAIKLQRAPGYAQTSPLRAHKHAKLVQIAELVVSVQIQRTHTAPMEIRVYITSALHRVKKLIAREKMLD